MKLTLGINKISAYVYANRTFKEDIMLFYNDISLKKCLSTDNVTYLLVFMVIDCENRVQVI